MVSRFITCAAWGGAAAACWTLAGQAAAYAVLAAAVAWVAGRLPAAVAAGDSAGEKARTVERRLDALVPRLPRPQDKPGDAGNTSYPVTNTSYPAANGSYSMGGGTNISYNVGSSNNGGDDSNTSGQIGGAAAHYHSMTHYHTSSGTLQNIFNALQGTMSDVVPCLNDLRDSHSTLLPAVNELRSTVSSLIPAHNSLLDTLQNSGILR